MFRADKVTQMASTFLRNAGGRMPYIKLMKLLYLADKQMLVERGKPITYDQWVSMRYGPVLSGTYDLIKAARTGSDSYWGRHIRTEDCDVVLVNDPGTDALSQAEDNIIEQVFAQHGHKDWPALVRMTHDLAEWVDPGMSSTPITYKEVLEVEGLPEEIIPDILENIEAQDELAELTVL